MSMFLMTTLLISLTLTMPLPTQRSGEGSLVIGALQETIEPSIICLPKVNLKSHLMNNSDGFITILKHAVGNLPFNEGFEDLNVCDLVWAHAISTNRCMGHSSYDDIPSITGLL